MALYLAQARTCTVHSPGDDGMSEPRYEDITRIVDADNEEDAKRKLREEYEKYIPYDIRVSLDKVRVSGVIR